MELNQIDWNEMWKEAMKKVSGKHEKVKQWDDLAKRMDEWMKRDDYSEKVMQRIKLNQSWTVLDIGCGTGSLAIPMAKKVKHVTALDVSKEMLRFLRENAMKEDLSNITCLNRSWQDVGIDKDIDEHDLVIASRSLGVTLDLKEELTKMNRIAKRYAYVTWKASERKFDSGVYKTLGREYHEYPGYIYIYNILYQMGIHANVELIECKSRICYRDLEDTIDDWRWKISDLSDEEEKILKDYLVENLVETDEGTLEAPNERSRWALIWWEK
ncbi:MAG: hypothetical protein MASP_00039 [Candidatus Methanolliviera sp. GoM_asphalt]|nr:MAG: hypothetical protein MASP_00039 [Candidatus Methanolliviera sp. GoM_asphalt]